MQRIYLDANATTPVLPEIVEAMRPFWLESFGNPSSAHQSGQRTRSAVEHARGAIAKLLHCTSKEIIFTSGGTESDNLALSGVLQPYLDSGEPAHLITSNIEHHAVLYTAESLERRGIEVTYLAPSRDGVIDPSALEAALKPHTKLVSIMLANNETGAVQPVGKLARIAKAHGTLVHTDAVQAAAKLPLDLSGEFKNVDLLSLSGHKMYAPQGTGVLFVRKGVQLAPLFHGGPHERQRRAGTENVPGIVGLGRAAELAHEWLNSQLDSRNSTLAAETPNPTSLTTLRDRLEQGLLNAIPNAYLNASGAPRVPNTTNLRITGVDAEALLIALDIQGIAASFGAACQSGATEPSHVLLAMGLSPAEARSSLRLSLSRLTAAEEIDRALEIIPAVVARLRSLS
ncbi:cysteine desulfurase family protein [Granulicella mallensis]|uniref:cysteine desulfurase n=1 Tax=Granulicella mallensis TaxID=940614 RepID=A0A7W7ZQV8_9BACT|nr:cysteine desulfurase family protein [Granulicella mallensis]MBB5064139.1 cysteine desulfurase [Granulicella mallensis]